MAWQFDNTTRSGFNQTIISNLSLGSANPEPRLLIKDAENNLLATVLLSDPVGTDVTGVLTLSGTPIATTAIAEGIAAVGEFVDRDATLRMAGTVGRPGSGRDIIISDDEISIGDPVTLVSGVLTAPGAI